MSPHTDRDHDRDRHDHDEDDEPGNGGRHWPPPTPKSTPYLVLAADAQDTGTRPIAYERAQRSQAIRLVHTLPEYSLQVGVTNTGPRACYLGIAEFYLGSLADFDAAAANPTGPTPRLLGVATFVSLPGKTTTVTCPVNLGGPGEEMMGSVLVQAYDPIFDPLEAPYSMMDDRHVGVLDLGA